MPYEKFKVQKSIAKKNEENILIELKEFPRRFKELLDKLNLSPMGLTKILKRMVSEGKIQKVLYTGHEAYSLTKEGKNEVEQLWYIYHELDYLKENKASYVHDLINSFTELDMVILDKENRNKISDSDPFSLIPNVPEFREFIENQVFNKVKERKLKVESSDGLFLVSFEFNLKRLSDFFNRIKIFIDDIKSNIDPVRDDRLGFMTIREDDRSYVLSSLVSHSDYFTKRDKKFNKNLMKYLESLDDKKKIEESFGVSYEILRQLTEDIKNGSDPLKDEKISNKLVVKDDNVTHFFINTYLQLAMFINVENKDVYSLVEEYSNNLLKWYENGEITLRSKGEINEVK
ncbi:MAG: hypothetical protein M1477_02690 [Candidatus Thermoplasmatota archaeon]|jgi:DNA-binding HxlR family transcriptional regulator|nr:hypothetical protein [Candidatus Thermoplasmatota archaeon]